jgi:hypothetical protein
VEHKETEQHISYLETQLQKLQEDEIEWKARLEERATTIQDLRTTVTISKEVEGQLQTALTENFRIIDRLKAEHVIERTKQVNRPGYSNSVPVLDETNQSVVKTLSDYSEHMRNDRDEAESVGLYSPTSGINLEKDLEGCTGDEGDAREIEDFRGKRGLDGEGDSSYFNKRQRRYGADSRRTPPRKCIELTSQLPKHELPKTEFTFRKPYGEQKVMPQLNEDRPVSETLGDIHKPATSVEFEPEEVE